MCFYTKLYLHSLKNDWVMAIFNIWPPRSRSKRGQRSKSRSDLVRGHLYVLQYKISGPYLQKWPSYGHLKMLVLVHLSDTTESSSKSKSIWPINYLISENAKTGLIKKVYFYMTGLGILNHVSMTPNWGLFFKKCMYCFQKWPLTMQIMLGPI